VPNFPRIDWKDWGTSNPLDYQGLLLDCRDPQSLPNHSSIATVLQTLMSNGHPAYILLPEAKNLSNPQGQMMFVPNYYLFAEEAFGQTLKLLPGDPFYESYRKAALAGHEICFRLQQMNNTPSLPILMGIVDNVSRPVCCKVGTVYLLHPPLKKLEQKAFKAIIEHFGPDPLPTSNVPKPSWVDQEASVIPGVAALQAVRASISAEIQERTERLNAEEEKLRKLSSWADLLWLEGLPLQNKVGEALELLGVKASSPAPTAHAGDLVADEPGVHLVFEVTGSTGTIGIEKGRQLMQWVADAPNPATTKGVLIANAFRNDPPNKRPPTDRRIFVVEVEQLATRYHLALVDVRELYRVLCVRLSGQEVDKTLVLNGLMADGVVRFQV
jgi:hypothetical protein